MIKSKNQIDGTEDWASLDVFALLAKKTSSINDYALSRSYFL